MVISCFRPEVPGSIPGARSKNKRVKMQLHFSLFLKFYAFIARCAIFIASSKVLAPAMNPFG